MDPHEKALTELISLARRRGSLAMEDLRRALPVDSMTIEDLSRVLTRLDQAGFDLDIDPALLGPDNETAAKNAPPVAKRDETEEPEPMPAGRQQQTSFRTSAEAPVPKDHTAQPSNSAALAPMLPWILAFVIVVLVVFAAFAF